jgi:hypothetical protein
LRRTAIFQTAFIAIHAAIIAAIVYVWRFSYFWLDDFNNLYWVQRETDWSMLKHVINPASEFFRPVGMLAYRILWQAFGLNPLPYHVAAWTLHAINVALVYVLLVRIVNSRFAAGVGTLLFSFRANFAAIYWSFGFIFELLACLFMLVALLLHIREKRSWTNVVLVLLLYVLAIKSKEMAVTLPCLFLAYNVSHQRRVDRKLVFEFLALAVIASWFIHLKLSTMASASTDHPYFLDFSVITAGRGFGWYFDRLYEVPLRWGAWIIMSTAAFVAMWFRREYRGVFFLAYIFIALMPLVFLVNHRGEFYWYIPAAGLSGMAAVFTHAAEQRIEKWIPTTAPALGLILFVTVAVLHCSVEFRKSRNAISEQRVISEEYAGFAGQLMQLPPPSPGETVRYSSFPAHFSLETLLSATQVILRRTDLNVDVPESLPTSCTYCLEYQNRTLKLRTAGGASFDVNGKEK